MTAQDTEDRILRTMAGIGSAQPAPPVIAGGSLYAASIHRLGEALARSIHWQVADLAREQDLDGVACLRQVAEWLMRQAGCDIRPWSPARTGGSTSAVRALLRLGELPEAAVAGQYPRATPAARRRLVYALAATVAEELVRHLSLGWPLRLALEQRLRTLSDDALDKAANRAAWDAGENASPEAHPRKEE